MATSFFLSSTSYNFMPCNPIPAIRSFSNISMKPSTIFNRKKNNLHIVSSSGLGNRVKDGKVFQKNFCIRSYEIGPHGKVSIETIMNHMQETILDHLNTAGVACDGLGSTPQMFKKNLIWVMTKVQMVVDRYPTWGDDVRVDNWLSTPSKNGMYTVNWIFRDSETGEIFIRVSSIWMLMNKNTRKQSKIPDEVRVEMDRFTIDRPPIVDDDVKNWPIHNNIANHVRNGLTPRWSDLDINQHVNNVKYIGWILESVPTSIVENYELVSMTLEYRQECNKNSVLQSHTSVLGDENGEIAYDNHVYCQHLLQFEVNNGGGAKIMKGKSRWRPVMKYANNFDLIKRSL